MKTIDELLELSAAYQYGYQDATTPGSTPLNLWAGDSEYKWAADDYETGYSDGMLDLYAADADD